MHEELIGAGALTEFDESKGKAMFVSHQWVSDTHPDPECEQLRVLQHTLINLASGSSHATRWLLVGNEGLKKMRETTVIQWVIDYRGATIEVHSPIRY